MKQQSSINWSLIPLASLAGSHQNISDEVAKISNKVIINCSNRSFQRDYSYCKLQLMT